MSKLFGCFFPLLGRRKRHLSSDSDMDSVEEKNVVLAEREDSLFKVHLLGATLLSWKVDDAEILFVSDKAVFDNKKAIRGGIPFVFPQFGPWSAGPQHGFARTSHWKLEKEPEKLPNGDVQAVFTLCDSDSTRALWDYRFKVTYTITLMDKKLNMEVDVKNTGESEFSFTVLLHTYFNVPDVTKCEVTGLKGITYVDKTRNEETFLEDREVVTVAQLTDRVYQNTPSEHSIRVVAGNRTITMRKHNFPDTVIWNPWKEKAKAMSDFGDDEYLNMICVEAGSVSNPVKLGTNQTFHASQVLELT
ncbi:putative glucose-6-phosphate 1-epimerase [Limulus polyphemus]|uniref:glucose-6-phosphate 1-epimerase n=1 Tax=Limulus polyphemus TaxID=6850 RepID=A0ABM1B337_LIMPO|nr:putative glucose-6-phosphate 1-epimerase [Limulus polyphemus]